MISGRVRRVLKWERNFTKKTFGLFRGQRCRKNLELGDFITSEVKSREQAEGTYKVGGVLGGDISFRNQTRKKDTAKIVIRAFADSKNSDDQVGRHLQQHGARRKLDRERYSASCRIIEGALQRGRGGERPLHKGSGNLANFFSGGSLVFRRKKGGNKRRGQRCRMTTRV